MHAGWYSTAEHRLQGKWLTDPLPNDPESIASRCSICGPLARRSLTWPGDVISRKTNVVVYFRCSLYYVTIWPSRPLYTSSTRPIRFPSQLRVYIGLIYITPSFAYQITLLDSRWTYLWAAFEKVVMGNACGVSRPVDRRCWLAEWFSGWDIGLWPTDFPWPVPDLWLTSCDHFVGKVSAMGQPTRPAQPFIPPESVNE